MVKCQIVKPAPFKAFLSMKDLYLPPNSKRMSDNERNACYDKMGSRCFELCPGGEEHDFRENRENSVMCDTEYVCVKCGYFKRVDSSD
jgi:hypothetical protein